MKTKLYEDDDQNINFDKYNDLGLTLDHEASELILPLFKKYIARGCGIRDISHIIAGAVNECELIEILTRTSGR